MQLSEIMSHPVRRIRASATAQDAAELLALHDVGALPVCENDRLVGILTDRDVIMRCVAPGRSLTATLVQEIMTPSPIALTPDANVEDAARIFINTRVRRLPVVEEDVPVGMVTVDDIFRLWDNEKALVLMARRVAPRNRRSAFA